MESDQILVYATTVDLDGIAVLLRGPSGSGKSDLALRLMEGGAVLVSDDQTLLTKSQDKVAASAPTSIQGLIEVRGVGVMRVPQHQDVALGLVVEMTPSQEVERLPEPQSACFLGQDFPLLHLSAFESSTPAKIRLWRRQSLAPRGGRLA